MAQWLVKEEPEHYSYEQLEKDRQTVWAGVKNPLAQKHLRSIRKGDRIFYYHTGKEKAVVATARAAGDAYPDPKDKAGKMYVVDVVADRKLPRPVTQNLGFPRSRCRALVPPRERAYERDRFSRRAQSDEALGQRP